MNPVPQLTPSELTIFLELLEKLHKTVDLKPALEGAYPLLRKLVPCDHGALCITRPDHTHLYDWIAADLPDSFFVGYERVAAHDFVRAAVAQHPNRVLRDHQMVTTRETLDRHPLFLFSREKGVRVEQIMAVMLSSDPSWHGGLTLYRDKRRPFSEHERDILQMLAPFFSSAVVNCRRFGTLGQWSSFLEKSLSMHRTSMLVLSSTHEIVACSSMMFDLFKRWFDPMDGTQDGLPAELWREVKRVCRIPVPPTLPQPWIPRQRGAGVVVTFVPLVEERTVYWMVLFDEIPPEWRDMLTPKEIDSAVRAAIGWDNALIADDLGCEVPTTKTHLFRVYDKLGVDTRAVLQARFRGRTGAESVTTSKRPQSTNPKPRRPR